MGEVARSGVTSLHEFGSSMQRWDRRHSFSAALQSRGGCRRPYWRRLRDSSLRGRGGRRLHIPDRRPALRHCRGFPLRLQPLTPLQLREVEVGRRHLPLLHNPAWAERVGWRPRRGGGGVEGDPHKREVGTKHAAAGGAAVALQWWVGGWVDKWRGGSRAACKECTGVVRAAAAGAQQHCKTHRRGSPAGHSLSPDVNGMLNHCRCRCLHVPLPLLLLHALPRTDCGGGRLPVADRMFQYAVQAPVLGPELTGPPVVWGGAGGGARRSEWARGSASMACAGTLLDAPLEAGMWTQPSFVRFLLNRGDDETRVLCRGHGICSTHRCTAPSPGCPRQCR